MTTLCIDLITVDHWPRLAWVASFQENHSIVTVYAGASVEVSEMAVVEGVWDGAFVNMDFDITDLFYGTGIRLRDKRIRFVSSCSTVDRLWWVKDGGQMFVSNSLPGILTVSRRRLDPLYQYYREDFCSIVYGLDKYKRSVPSTPGRIEVLFWEDIEFDGRKAVIVPKTSPERQWPDFPALRSFYFDTAQRIGENARSRTNPIVPIATVSSGYDSPAAALMAREAGATQSFTIESARSLLPRSDSGEAIADCLGLDCSVVPAGHDGYQHEEFFVAALGWSMDLNMSLFRLKDPVTLLFTGFHGDRIWDRSNGVLDEHIVRGDPSGLGMSEYRLFAGIINCPVPYWGGKQAARIRQIALSEEMKPWSIRDTYDRPIPRRLVEEAGVGRRMFGQRKSATTIDEVLMMPRTRDGAGRFRTYLQGRAMRWPWVTAIRCLNHFDRSIASRFRRRWGVSWPTFSVDVASSSFLVDWAVGTLMEEHYSHTRFTE